MSSGQAISNPTLLLLCALHSFAFGAFHLPFGGCRLREQLALLSRGNRGIVQILNLRLTYGSAALAGSPAESGFCAGRGSVRRGRAALNVGIQALRKGRGRACGHRIMAKSDTCRIWPIIGPGQFKAAPRATLRAASAPVHTARQTHHRA